MRIDSVIRGYRCGVPWRPHLYSSCHLYIPKVSDKRFPNFQRVNM